MDWRHNQWVGVGAAVALVLGVVGLFMYVNRSTTPTAGTFDAGGAGLLFQCDSTGQTFFIPVKDLDDEATYEKYFGRIPEASPCKICGKTDAYQVYYCEVCQKYYRYKRGQDEQTTLHCPLGHEVGAAVGAAAGAATE
jgi:hypothetical protein